MFNAVENKTYLPVYLDIYWADNYYVIELVKEWIFWGSLEVFAFPPTYMKKVAFCLLSVCGPSTVSLQSIQCPFTGCLMSGPLSAIFPSTKHLFSIRFSSTICMLSLCCLPVVYHLSFGCLSVVHLLSIPSLTAFRPLSIFCQSVIGPMSLPCCSLAVSQLKFYRLSLCSLSAFCESTIHPLSFHMSILFSYY